ncbi:hypothetical protein [Sediminispirochaeta bajacaliforniensis]|uniref:hypothetical protein n=1 Tax=Sediminispirochaeta bajacaliforniensis TaxID=148 RepID=UPI000524F706|nr:hypothetical protein [Sediminispirochaeta bajacaliforniensis]
MAAMEIGTKLACFLQKEEPVLQASLDTLLESHPLVRELDLEGLLSHLFSALFETFSSSPDQECLRVLFLHGMRHYLPALLKEGETTIPAEMLLESWLLLRPLISGQRLLSADRLPGVLERWELALRRLPDNSMRRSWLDHMARYLDQCTRLEQVFALGRLAAWILGLAEQRQAALESADLLPEKLIGELLHIEKSGLKEARDNPWFFKGSFTEGRIGGFAGYGGPFLQPPTCRRLEGGALPASSGLVAHDRKNGFHLFADSFGCRLVYDPALLTLSQNLPEAHETERLLVDYRRDSHYLWVRRKGA